MSAYLVPYVREHGTLYNGERLWRNNYDWLREQGYTLRERYKPDWVPSWKAQNRKNGWKTAEDGASLQVSSSSGSLRYEG